MEKMDQTSADCKRERMDHTLNALKTSGERAAREGTAAHEVETGIWRQVLRLGSHALEVFCTRVGPGDAGESVRLPDGREVRRLETRHPRVYQSVVGRFELERVVYGSREGQQIEYVPFDTRLQLPEREFSSVLQDWSQGVAVEQADRRVPETRGRILDGSPRVESLERMNLQMAETVRPFRESRPAPEPEAEGVLGVVSADGKGIPMRRPASEAPMHAHDWEQEPTTNRKKMAVVGTVYTIDPFVRSPEDVAASLFRAPDDAPLLAERPFPQQKRLWARLPQDRDGAAVSAADETCGWLAHEGTRRNPGACKPTVWLMDGQQSLWETAERDLPRDNAVAVLDLLHATPRIWDAAHLVYPGDADQALDFVYDRVLRILPGDVRSVVSGLGQMGTKRKLRGTKRDKLATLCGSLQHNAHRMRYDAYLAFGYPIASGVIEGACRHFVKDRMERSGMRWTIESAQAMLDVRSTDLNGDWDTVMTYRIEKETQRLYPYRELVEPIEGMQETGLPITA
jgi:hypothetical protein